MQDSSKPLAMKKNLLFTFVILTAFSFTSCDKDDVLAPHLLVKGESGISYLESKSSWHNMKQENGNSYEYTLEVISFTGHGNRTSMSIDNGKVMERSFMTFFLDPDTGDLEETPVYTETGAEVGSNSEGARPLTIDALYEICASEYLVVDAEDNMIYFDTNGEGVMSLCGYVPVGCADDCFEGITFSHFAWK